MTEKDKDRRNLKQGNGEGSDSTPADSNAKHAGITMPEINFATFIASLNASALVNLGIIADPASGTIEKNLPLAKQTIDIMSMLKEKTKGNLAADEESILKSILYDLKLMYVREKG